MLCTMSSTTNFEGAGPIICKGGRSHSAQGLGNVFSSPSMKIPLPPRLWITDVEDESSDGSNCSAREDGVMSVERSRVRSRFRHYKQRTSIPIGIFWDIENCQVPRGCSAIDVVSAIRSKFLTGRREADFVVVCDVRKETTHRLQELNDAQISLIHVCGTQKNAADEKLRQCMRRFGELHTAPASLLLISGDINFAADLSDFRHRKNMEVILVHKQKTSSALIACASSHYCYNELIAHLPRTQKNCHRGSGSESLDAEDESAGCEMEVDNLPGDQPAERVSRRLRRLADNCGGKVVRLQTTTATLRFPTPDHASRALKRMDGEDVFGRKISTRYARSAVPPTYSSDEGYSTAPPGFTNPQTQPLHPHQMSSSPCEPAVTSHSGADSGISSSRAANEWALALKQLPAPTPPPLEFCPPPAPAPRLRQIRGTHGSASAERSACSSSNSGEQRAVSPWNWSGSERSGSEDEPAELTVTNLPPVEPLLLQEMLTQLFSQYVGVARVSVWAGSEGPLATVVVRSEADARLAIARVHKRRLDNHWAGRRLELSLGRPNPAPNLDVLRARLRAILLDQQGYSLPLLRLRDAYASRHCCALTTSDLGKVKDTVIVHEGFGRIVQLIDLTPVPSAEMEEAPWKCHVHAGLNTSHEDGSRILQPVFMEVAALAKNVKALLESHGGILPLLSFVECYEAMFPPLLVDSRRGVPLELLLRAVSGVEVRDSPSRHLAWQETRSDTPPGSNSLLSTSSRSSSERERPTIRTAPALEPMLALFERELIDLLRSAPRCCIPFSKLIPAFHHHFGRQCRVADYGFTKLPDLLAALGNTIVVLGSGSSRVITISAAAQARRWTSDLVKMLKNQPGRSVLPHDIPQLYQATFGAPFSPAEYGVCTLDELVGGVGGAGGVGAGGAGAGGAVLVSPEGALCLPRRTPAPEERARTTQFAMQAMELLCYTPNLRMEFSRFVPAYHAHFARQLRVAHYGCVKLIELFELIPEAVAVGCEPNGDRSVRLAIRPAKVVIGERLQSICPVPLATLPAVYAARFGAPPQPEALDVTTVEELVFACGGSVESGLVRAPGDSPRWAAAQLSAAAVLAADRSVARGSTLEYFESAFRRMRGVEPETRNLVAAGVIEVCDRRVLLTPSWRAVYRLACILADRPRQVDDLLRDYMCRYNHNLAMEMGVEGITELLRAERNVFIEAGALWALRSGVTPPRHPAPAPHEDYSLHDTPPGQKGSRVWDSPRVPLWCSPPASALPPPTALLAHDSKRRTRLAAQFDS